MSVWNLHDSWVKGVPGESKGKKFVLRIFSAIKQACLQSQKINHSRSTHYRIIGFCFFSIFTVLTLALNQNVHAQDSSVRPAFDLEYAPHQVEFNQGVAWLYNSPERSFYFVVYKDKISATSNPNVFLIGKKIFRVYLFDPDPEIPVTPLDSMTSANVLNEYVKGRMEVFRQGPQLGAPKVRMRKLMRQRIAIEWSFATPGDEVTLGHAFISTICFNRILTLNRAIRKGEDLNDARIWLRKVVNSIILQDEPMGPKGLGKKLNE